MFKLIYQSTLTDKPIIQDSGVNVFYFTNRCNLACTYCYEKLPETAPGQVIKKEQIEEFIDQVLERENPSEQTLFVLFGGEPTLEWDNVMHFMKYAYSKKKNVVFNLCTNGLKFLSDKFLLEVINTPFYAKKMMSIDISFDGIGNAERIYPNGKTSTSDVIKVFKKLDANQIRYRIRYTIHKLNVAHAYDDILHIINTFSADRVITSIAWSQLNDAESDYLLEIKERLRKKWKDKSIHIPVCEFFCDICKGCSQQKEIKTYFTSTGNINKYSNNEIAPQFNDFLKVDK